MTVLFLDSFDHYTTSFAQYKYTTFYTGGGNTVISAGNGRISTDAMYVNGKAPNTNGGFMYTTGNKGTLVVGGAFKIPTLVYDDHYLIAFYDNTTPQAVLQVQEDGLLKASYGGVTLSDRPITANSYYYIEMKVVFHASAGSVEVRVGEVPVISVSGVDTIATANAYATNVRVISDAGLTTTGQAFYLDDFYIDDSDFLGDIHVEALFPTANGSQTDWTVGGTAGTANYECVDDNPPDSDSSYTYTDEIDTPKTDLYEMNDMSIISGDIYAIQTVMFSRKDNADAVLVTPAVMPGTVLYNPSGTVSLTETYKFNLSIIEENPDTSAAFTVSEVNASEFGYTRPS